VLRRWSAHHKREGAVLDGAGPVYGDVLLLGVLVQCVRSAFAPEAALLVAAEGVVRVDDVPVVDVDHAGFQAPGDVECPLFVAAPDAGGQAVVGVVGDRDGLVDRVVGQDREYGPEHLFPGDGHVVGDVGEDGRLDPVADLELRPVGGAAADGGGRALGLGAVEVAKDPLLLLPGDDRAYVGGRIERVAECEGLGPLDQFGQELVLDAARDQQPGSGLAGLAVVGHRREQGSVDGNRQVGVVEDDVRALAAEFEGDPLDGVRGLAEDALADSCRAGKRHFAHVGVPAQVEPDRLAVTDDDVQDTLGQAGGLELPGNFQREQWGVLVRLEHDGVAGGQGRGDFPDDHQQRDVPRHDGGDHAEWFAAQDALGGQGPDRGAWLFELVALGQSRQILQLPDGQAQVQGGGDPDGGAILPGLQHREFVGAFGEPGGHRVEQVGALLGCLAAPYAGGVGGLGCGDGPVDVLRAPLGDGAHQLAGGRAADLVTLRRVNPFAVDEQ